MRIPSIQNIQILFCMFIVVRNSFLNILISDQAINHLTTYIWEISFINQIQRSEITLNFTNSITLTNNIAVSLAGYQLTYTINSSSLNVNIPESQKTQTHYRIEVANIINPPRAQFIIFSVISNQNQNIQCSYPIYYVPGTIQDCVISFQGHTYQNQSNAQISLTNKNPISIETVKFQINFQFSYNQNGIRIPYGTVCSLIVNGINLGEVFGDVQSFSSMTCTFNISSQIVSGSQIILKLQKFVNPRVSISYGNFQIETSDGFYKYDLGYCIGQAVQISKYFGQFQNTYPINTIYVDPKILLQTPISIPIFSDDMIEIIHPNLRINYLQQIMLQSSSGYILQYEKYTQSINSISFKTNSNSNLFVGINKIMLAGQIVSGQYQGDFPVVLRFSTNNNIYMEIIAQLITTKKILTQNQVTVSVQNLQIGQSTQYSISIHDPNNYLSISPTILIEFPQQISFQQFKGQCQIFTSIQTINNVTCQQINNIVNLTFQSQQQIPTEIEIIIHDITNPQQPENIQLSFDIKIYHEGSDNSSISQEGIQMQFPVFQPHQAQVEVIEYDNYTVNEISSLKIVLNTSTILLFPIKINIMFSDWIDFTKIILQDVAINESAVHHTVQKFQKNYTITIQSSSSNKLNKMSYIHLHISFKTPHHVGSFQLGSLKAYSNNTLYQQSHYPLIIKVTNPAQVFFSVIPNQSVTGVQAIYAFNKIYQSGINYQQPNILQITIPQNINIGSNTQCLGDCSQAVIYQSHNLLGIMILDNEGVSKFNLSNFINPREVGKSIIFYFKLYTVNNELYGIGNATTNILSPNNIFSIFNPDANYYRSNSQPVSIKVQTTNNLYPNDYIQLKIPFNAYTADEIITCFSFSCSIQQQITNQISIIKIIIDQNTDNQQINIVIDGLTSSANTLYYQNIQIQIRTYSSNNYEIDRGNLIYNISCGQISEKMCKSCNHQNCTSCYDSFHLYQSEGICTNNCGQLTLYETFPSSGVCVSCIYPCLTCLNQTFCLTCLNNYYLYQNKSCHFQCDTNGGYFIQSINNINLCLQCHNVHCLSCQNHDCTLCDHMSYLINGECLSQCPLNLYPSNNACYPCDQSCIGCIGSGNHNCIQCAPQYFKYSNYCLNQCPFGTVIIQGSQCGCYQPCATCQKSADNCLTCMDISNFVYNGRCIQQCPVSTYVIGLLCIDCQVGCKTCSASQCLQCYDTSNMVYQNKCIESCELLGQNYISLNNQSCIKCPQNCIYCQVQQICMNCSSSYVLGNGFCNNQQAAQESTSQQQQQTNQNQNGQKDDEQIPSENNSSISTDVGENVGFFSGTIISVGWAIAIVPLKLFVTPMMYIPFAFMSVGGALEQIQVMVLVSKNTNSQNPQNRLLQARQSGLTQNEQQLITTLLIIFLVLNYIANMIYLFVFFKYLKRFMPNTTLNKILNYVLLGIGTIVTFKIALISLAKVLPYPSINLPRQNYFRPIKYLCIFSLITTIMIGCSTVGFILYKQPAQSPLYLLSIDILIVLILDAIFTLIMIIIKKPESYYKNDDNKVEQTQQNIENTTEDNQNKNRMNNSQHDLIGNAIANIDNPYSDIDQKFNLKYPKKQRKKLQSIGKQQNKRTNRDINKFIIKDDDDKEESNNNNGDQLDLRNMANSKILQN